MIQRRCVVILYEVEKIIHWRRCVVFRVEKVIHDVEKNYLLHSCSVSMYGTQLYEDMGILCCRSIRQGTVLMDMSCRSIIHGALLYENVGILSCIYMHVHFEYEATLCDDVEILPCTYIIYGMVKIWTLPCTQFQYLLNGGKRGRGRHEQTFLETLNNWSTKNNISSLSLFKIANGEKKRVTLAMFA